MESATTWRRISTVMVLGTAVYGGIIAFDIATSDNHHGPSHGGEQAETLSLHSEANAQTAAYGEVSTGPYKLGRTATPDEVAAWDIDVRPDGQGLPDGQGSVADGEVVYQERCAVCHGVFGEAEGRWPVLAGGQGTLTSDRPVKTIGSYWPYLSTVFDYVHRAMPFGDAQSLTPDEVYGITAYLMYLNDLVDEDFVLSKDNFQEVRLPNEQNFFMDDREKSPVFTNHEACMENCKDKVEITMHAAVVDVTPEDATSAPEGLDLDGSGGGGGEKAAVVEAKAEAPAAEPAPAAAPAGGGDAELIAAGEKVFKKCKSCHQVGDGAKHRVGPILNGVVGRAAGSADGFTKYSKAMEEAAGGGLVWTDDKLAEFLAKPKGFLKGTSMGFAGLKDDDDIKAVIAYMKDAGK